jgi:16S rRNA C967 or C1407 C5-methylase (RsmB/RsmF family)
MKYVKATERLPEKEARYFVRHTETHEKGVLKYLPGEKGWWIGPEFYIQFKDVEWLDESEESSQDAEIEKLKERLIDAHEECEKLEERAESAEKSSKEWCTKVIEAAIHRQELQREIERLKKALELEENKEINKLKREIDEMAADPEPGFEGDDDAGIYAC